ncbi:MAG TPA: lysylphosphatidylglycerol synthase transmembrane domain-containing protein [Chitinophagaceae bacterium]|nr:lysylphosphatidylglycerol synthase transmembrane domain-containing protein [Chitinophagaceae bacterium]
MPQQFKNILKLFLKLAVTAICLWYVSKKIDWTLTWQLLQQSNKWWLVAAAVLFILSKIVSSYRLNIFFKNIGIHLSETANLKLYWTGMFYNLFLPGGIGGDAYKVILLNRKRERSVKLLSAAVLLDRLSGVVGLAILAAIYFSLISLQKSYATSLLAAIVPALIVYYLFIKKVFPSFLSAFTPTLLLGLLVQVLQVLCAYCIMASIQITEHQSAYIFIFLLSSIVAILPFTIGGLGAREVVFLWGSNLFLLDKHQSIYISILFYLITILVSFVGMRWSLTPQTFVQIEDSTKAPSQKEGGQAHSI